MPRRVLAFLRARVWTRYGILAVLLVALVVQLYHLDARTLHGDELTSIFEAKYVGQNPNGLLYFGFLHYWLMLGMSEIWLRLPSALLATAVVAVGYELASILADRKTGLLMAALLATSPFMVEYGQQVRFYALFLFAGSLAYLAFVLYMQKPARNRLAFLVLSDLLVLGAHFFGLLVIASQVLAALLATKRFTFRFKVFLCVVAILIFAALLGSAQVRAFIYAWVSRLTNPYGEETYTGARGLSVSNLAKIPLTFFFFGFGERVYPLALYWIVPGLVLMLIASGWGLRTLWARSRISIALIVSLFLFPLLLYLVFDPLSGPGLQGAAPRYLVFLLPLFYLLLAAGSVHHRFQMGLTALLLLTNIGGLASYWSNTWAYSDDLIDWRVVTRWVSDYVTPQSIALMDYRSERAVNFYFPSTWQREGTWNFEMVSDRARLDSYARIIFLSGAFQQDRRTSATALLRALEQQFDRRAAWGQYPLFVYVYDRKPAATDGSRVDSATGSLNLPATIYGVEFQDLRLPFAVDVGNRTVQITGALALPGLEQEREQRVELALPTTARRMVLLSNWVGGDALPGGTLIANLKIEREDGTTATAPLRLGYETASWKDNACQPHACRAALTWRKRLALLGNAAYPGSWEEFSASLWAADLVFELRAPIRALHLQRTNTPGVLYVWGIVFEP